MLRSMKDMEDYTIGATDGIIGRPNWSEKVLPVSMTRAQIQSSPDIDTHKPVSRQHEMGYLGYYGCGMYWGAGGLWGAGIYPGELQGGLQNDAVSGTVRHQDEDVHLRSGNEIMRYYVHASDGDIGHVQGLIVDENSWAIRYIIVNTSNWWLGHQVIIAPEWIDDVDWAESKLSIDLTRQAIKDSPHYDPNAPLSRERETQIHNHYGRAGYWPRESKHSSVQARL